MVFSRIMIAARIVSYIVEYTAPAWHRRHVDSRPRRAIHPPISPYHGHPRSIPFVRPLNGQAEPPPWCSIIDTYPSCRLAFPRLHVPDALRPSILCLCECISLRPNTDNFHSTYLKITKRYNALVGLESWKIFCPMNVNRMKKNL